MYAIHKNILLYFGAYTNPSFGAIKPALTKLEKDNCITSTKFMSEGGRLSILYSITKEGRKELKNLILKSFSGNPVQFFSDARIKLSCCDILSPEEKNELCNEIMTKVLLQKINAEKLLNDEYTPTTTYQQKILENTICECSNFVNCIEEIKKI